MSEEHATESSGRFKMTSETLARQSEELCASFKVSTVPYLTVILCGME